MRVRDSASVVIADPGSGRGGNALQVSVVLPCLNEERSVGLCVQQALASLERAGLRGEVVVVDNGSSDDSAKVARDAGARVVNEEEPGYGSALMAGIRAARSDVVVMADADFAYDLDRTADLAVHVLAGDADLVIGARIANRKTMPWLHRFVGTPVLTFLVARASGRKVATDSQSGFRAFRRGAVLDLGMRGSGMEFASEMIIRAVGAGWRIREVMTSYRVRIGESKLNTFRDGWRHLRLIVLLAPDLVLVWPGAASLLAGLALSAWTLADPSGISLGSLRWQPVFFSTIAMVFGVQALLAGSVIAYQVSIGGPHRRSAFIVSRRFLRRCVLGGVAGTLFGLSADAMLFMVWITDGSMPTRGLQLAAFAQSMILVGISLATFGAVARLILGSRLDDAVMSSLPLGDTE